MQTKHQNQSENWQRAGARSLALLLLLAVVVGAQQTPPPLPPPPLLPPNAPAVAPQLKLQGLDGKTYDVAQMRGEVVLASFGATWCKPCEWELQALEELKQEYADRPVRFLWISIESEQTAPNAWLRQFARARRLTMPVLRDPERTTYAQFSNTVRLPLVVFFDRTGAFVAPKHTGMAPDPIQYKQLIRSRLDALLGAPPAAGSIN